MVSMISVILVVVAMTWLAAALGVFVWFGALAALRAMAKVDPLLSKVYLRHIRYRSYYPAHATIFAPPSRHVRNK